MVSVPGTVSFEPTYFFCGHDDHRMWVGTYVVFKGLSPGIYECWYVAMIRASRRAQRRLQGVR